MLLINSIRCLLLLSMLAVGALAITEEEIESYTLTNRIRSITVMIENMKNSPEKLRLIKTRKKLRLLVSILDRLGLKDISEDEIARLLQERAVVCGKVADVMNELFLPQQQQ
jgi:hypothetical protein